VTTDPFAVCSPKLFLPCAHNHKLLLLALRAVHLVTTAVILAVHLPEIFHARTSSSSSMPIRDAQESVLGSCRIALGRKMSRGMSCSTMAVVGVRLPEAIELQRERKKELERERESGTESMANSL
jgi:hypothetical protein